MIGATWNKIIQYSGSIGGTGLSSLVLPTDVNPSIDYNFDTTKDPGFFDIHRGFLGDTNDDGTVILTVPDRYRFALA